MPIVGGLDIHRKQLTFDCVDLDTGELRRGKVAPADRKHLAVWLARSLSANDEVVQERIDGKRAALSQARKIVRQACHILTELGDDALTLT
jgi:hypothetical protein